MVTLHGKQAFGRGSVGRERGDSEDDFMAGLVGFEISYLPHDLKTCRR